MTAADLSVGARPVRLSAPPAARLWLLAGLAVVAFLLELSLGTVRISAIDVLRVLTGQSVADENWVMIVQTVRVPRALTAAWGGAALGVSGLALQTLFRNRLAGPWLLGVTGGARLGVAVLILIASTVGYVVPARLGVQGGAGVALFASLGAAGVLALMALAARRVSSVSLLILGLMLTFLATGLTSVLLHLVSEDQARIWAAWNDGNFGGVTWPVLRLLLPAVTLGVAVTFAMAKPLDALLLGEHYAASVGAPVVRTRRVAFAAVALLAGTVTAFCGVVAFLDVAVPQMARGVMRTSHHRVLVPAAAFLGAALAMLADLLAHLPVGNEILHLNAITAVLGAPVVMAMIVRRDPIGD